MSFTIESEKQSRMSFLDIQVIRDDKAFTTSTVNLPLVKFIHILKALCHVPISLVLFTRLLIDASEHGQVGLNYILN